MSRITSVGLDMSLTSTGFCLKSGTRMDVETIKTTPKTHPHDLDRLQYIVKECLKRIPADVDMICIEDYFIPLSKAQFGAAIKLCQLGTLMRIALYNKGYKFYIPTASQLKKFATGKGNVPKSVVVREVYKRWGLEAKDDNQADACTLAHMAEALIEQRDDYPKYQIDTLKKVFDDRPSYNID
jgi:crossover junction endodeoxyribonuclease RuvC